MQDDWIETSFCIEHTHAYSDVWNIVSNLTYDNLLSNEDVIEFSTSWRGHFIHRYMISDHESQLTGARRLTSILGKWDGCNRKIFQGMFSLNRQVTELNIVFLRWTKTRLPYVLEKCQNLHSCFAFLLALLFLLRWKVLPTESEVVDVSGDPRLGFCP